jgi:hypothetical protein
MHLSRPETTTANRFIGSLLMERFFLCKADAGWNKLPDDG